MAGPKRFRPQLGRSISAFAQRSQSGSDNQSRGAAGHPRTSPVSPAKAGLNGRNPNTGQPICSRHSPQLRHSRAAPSFGEGSSRPALCLARSLSAVRPHCPHDAAANAKDRASHPFHRPRQGSRKQPDTVPSRPGSRPSRARAQGLSEPSRRTPKHCPRSITLLSTRRLSGEVRRGPISLSPCVTRLPSPAQQKAGAGRAFSRREVCPGIRSRRYPRPRLRWRSSPTLRH